MNNINRSPWRPNLCCKPGYSASAATTSRSPEPSRRISMDTVLVMPNTSFNVKHEKQCEALSDDHVARDADIVTTTNCACKLVTRRLHYEFAGSSPNGEHKEKRERGCNGGEHPRAYDEQSTLTREREHRDGGCTTDARRSHRDRSRGRR